MKPEHFGAVRSDDGTALEPVPGAWPLRGWRAPAGDYAVALTFRMPWFRTAAMVSIVATCAWIVILVAGRRKRPLEPGSASP